MELCGCAIKRTLKRLSARVVLSDFVGRAPRTTDINAQEFCRLEQDYSLIGRIDKVMELEK